MKNIRLSLLLLILFYPSGGQSKPSGGTVFCQAENSSPLCTDGKVECNFCHSGPPVLNFYGKDLLEALPEGEFDEGIAAAISSISDSDSDSDDTSNSDEIAAGTFPGDKESKPDLKNVEFKYDELLAYTKAMAIYCGESLDYEQVTSFQTSSDKKTLIHKTLDRCLESEYWTKEALYRMADQKINPMKAVGSLEAVVKIGEYDWDYHMYAFFMSGDRDIRDLLKADYHVDDKGQIKLGKISYDIKHLPQVGKRVVIAGGQPLDPKHRVGILTNQWFLSINTMFAKIPRNAASQAYRAFLGQDLAKGEGLLPVENEPQDLDKIGIAKPACAVCHSTLDPASYAFTDYHGIVANGVGAVLNRTGTYKEKDFGQIVTNILIGTKTDPLLKDGGGHKWADKGSILGKKVKNLHEWAEVARNSPLFFKKMTLDIFVQALGRKPMSVLEKEEFEILWNSLPENGFSINKLIHAFVDTKSFGGKVTL